MTRHLITSIYTCGLILMGSIAWAHEGHGHTPGQGHTPTHYLTEPYHLLQWGALALGVFVIGWLGLRWFYSSAEFKRTSNN